jgi:hypothetical protein
VKAFREDLSEITHQSKSKNSGDTNLLHLLHELI